MKTRSATIKRKTSETDITLCLDVDGTGQCRVKTPIPFFNHMLEAFARHGLFDLDVSAGGDVNVDDHHLVEDVGICLGEAFKKALGDKKGIRRYGHFTLPMDEALTTVALDFSGRACLVYKPGIKSGRIKNFDIELVGEFFHAIANTAMLNLHIHVVHGGNKHHVVESIFKAFARAMDMAASLDPRVMGIPSTKGKL